MQYFPDFEMQWASEGRVLPDYVRREFDEFLKWGRLEHGIRASMHIIACIEDPAVISKILTHLQEQSPMDSGVQIPSTRAPPQARLFSEYRFIYVGRQWG